MNELLSAISAASNVSLINMVKPNQNVSSADGDFSSSFKAAQSAAKVEKPVRADNSFGAKAAADYERQTVQQPASDTQQPAAANNASAPQTDAVPDAETVEAVPPVAEKIADDLNISLEDMLALLQAMGVVLPPEMSTRDVPEFLAQVLSAIDQRIGAIAELVAAPSDDLGQKLAALLENITAKQSGTITLNNLLPLDQSVTFELPAENAPAPVVADSGVQTAFSVQTTVTEYSVGFSPAVAQTEPDTEPDTAAVPEIELPITDKSDGTAITLQELRNRIAALVTETPEPETETETVEIKPIAAEETVETEEIPEIPQEKVSEKHEVRAESNTFVPRHTAVRNETPVAPQTVQNVTPQQIVNQIVESARMNQAFDGTSQLEIQLKPEHLGRVSVILTAAEDGVTAHIKTANNDARNLLAAGLGDLMASLKEMGVNMKGINISQSELAWDFARGAAGGETGFGERRDNSRDGEQGNRGNQTQSVQIMRLSNLLYGTNALQPMGTDVSVEFLA